MAQVLIVDDESSVLFLLREVLEERGHAVLSATSGLEAAALSDLGKLDDVELLLTDFAMPELDGLGLMARLKRQNPELPVVLLTARGSERLAARAIKEGAFDYLPKPFELDELNAGAHYLLALCFERREDLAVAAEHDRTAVYLDAGFAMPHLHLGLMARRRRDNLTAKHELGQALWLLEREDPARLLLFGGGFTRGALLKLCRSELENLRGAT